MKKEKQTNVYKNMLENAPIKTYIAQINLRLYTLQQSAC
jgi:hypothetical protein